MKIIVEIILMLNLISLDKYKLAPILWMLSSDFYIELDTYTTIFFPSDRYHVHYCGQPHQIRSLLWLRSGRHLYR